MYTLFGLVGGLIKILLLLGYLATKPIAELSYRVSVVNKIFDFQKKEKLENSVVIPSPNHK